MRAWMSLQLLLAVSAALHHAAAFMNFNQPCAPFRCAKSTHRPVPKEKFVFTVNGCGTAALPISTTTDFTDCCNWHDSCYSTCGMKKSKCEKRLDKCMREKCALITDEDAREQCESTAKIFSIGAQMIACPAYQDAQRDACRCVPEDAVDDAYRARLVHFLKTQNAPREDLADEAIDALLAKYKGQEATMFLRLLVKYPQAMQIDKRKRNFMEDVFKGAKGENELDDVQMPDKMAVGLNERDDEDAPAADEHIEL
ncbi:hypothetical protein ATCC90586_008725 [Pythium insidiosum]|nr:hypothetical protein ATCC90586_008725 [Pythium insidiosum]